MMDSDAGPPAYMQDFLEEIEERLESMMEDPNFEDEVTNDPAGVIARMYNEHVAERATGDVNLKSCCINYDRE